MSMIPTVLIVEDDDGIAEAMRARLEAVGCRVFHAVTSRAGIGGAEHYRPHVVILDLQLRGEDGVATCAAIRRISGLEDVGIVVLSGLSRQIYRTQALAAGADMFLSKPCQSADLLAAVFVLLERQKQVLGSLALSTTIDRTSLE